jgi:chaperonin GroEL (HSP60 family)
VNAMCRVIGNRTVAEMKANRFSLSSIPIVSLIGNDDNGKNAAQLIKGIIIPQGVSFIIMDYGKLIFHLKPRDIEMPKAIENVKLLLINESLEVERDSSTPFVFSSAKQRVQLLNDERKKIERKIQIIVESGANVVFSLRGIDATSLQQFSKHGIYALRHMRKVYTFYIYIAAMMNLLNLSVYRICLKMLL